MLGREYVPEKEAIAVEVGLTNGDLLKGRLWVPPGKSLADALNTAQTFLEFTPYGEEHPRYVAKGQIISLRVIDVPKSVPLYERRGASGADDPHQILAVAPGAPWLAVREAYLRLAKAYHPDRFSGMELPKEVLEYLNAKARRINVAYELLEDTFKRTANAAAEVATRTARYEPSSATVEQTPRV